MSKAEKYTYEAVREQFDALVAHTSRDLNDRFEEAITGVTRKLLSRGPTSTAEQFVLDVTAALDGNTDSEVVIEKGRCKQLLVKLVREFEPLELNKLVRDQMGMWTADQKGNLTFFSDKICSLANQVHSVRSETSKRKRKREQIFQKNNQSSGEPEPPRKEQKTGGSPRTRLEKREKLNVAKERDSRVECNKLFLNKTNARASTRLANAL